MVPAQALAVTWLEVVGAESLAAGLEEEACEGGA
jgi:hypothetical protein